MTAENTPRSEELILTNTLLGVAHFHGNEKTEIAVREWLRVQEPNLFRD